MKLLNSQKNPDSTDKGESLPAQGAERTKGFITPVYNIDDRPPLQEAIPLGLQHVLAMFAGNVAVPIIIANVLGLSIEDKSFLIQSAMFVAGIATLLQTIGIGRVGGKLPIVMGTSFGFMPTAIGIGKQFGLAAILGASFVAGWLEVVLGFFLKTLRKLFPPLVTGTVVLAIGLSLLPVGINYAAGGVGSPDFGSLPNLFLAGLVLAISVFLNQYCKGIWSAASILIGMIIGYLVAMPMGMVDFTPVTEASWFSIPKPLVFGMEFHASAIIAMLIMYIVTTVETVGDISAITMGGASREATDRELSGGVMADGVGSIFGALFNTLPNTSFSQNVGLVSFTGVMSRYVVSIGALFLAAAGLIPKLGSVLAIMPQSVLGGGAIVMFSTVATSGIVLISRSAMTHRNLLVVAISLGLGLGLGQVPQALQHLPVWVGQIFTSSGIAIVCLVALFLNLVLPQDPRSSKREG